MSGSHVRPWRPPYPPFASQGGSSAHRRSPLLLSLCEFREWGLPKLLATIAAEHECGPMRRFAPPGLATGGRRPAAIGKLLDLAQTTLLQPGPMALDQARVSQDRQLGLTQ